ncbi:MAG TPA: ATP-binding protein [Steroidobacteraceae bacterium]|nr:sensor histidine kinase N-terminal domain-containing protein [Gammaproteobacteria bacterium]HEV2286766.1 ATP-binding protein [Steroidobacteraceae bacterium]
MAVATALAACAAFLVLGLLVYRAVDSSTRREFDEMLAQQAALALRYAEHEYGEGETVVPRSLRPGERPMPFELAYQITTRAGEVLYRSPRTPAEALATGLGHADAVLDGRAWRVVTLESATTPLVIHMAEPLGVRDALLARTTRAVTLPLVLALLLLTALIGFVTERAFRPVRRIAADLAGRGAGDLSPVDTAAMPVETHALGVALNGLLARHAEVLARERRFTADAAHELRTPLAALRAQAQVAARAGSCAETRRALEKLQAGIDRTTHLMGQLLSLARLEPGSAFAAGQTTAARKVVELVLEDLASAARDKQLAVVVRGEELLLPGSPEVLYLLLRNLLENSIRHVAPRGQVRLEMSAAAGGALLAVSDDGPGIPAAERTRALERFYRIPGSGSAGSGLGLSIVGRIVELLAGTIDLTAPPAGTGLVVSIRLPLADAPGPGRAAA